MIVDERFQRIMDIVVHSFLPMLKAGVVFTVPLTLLPQATRVSVPPLSNSFISLVKDTSLAATITVTEMFRVAQQITSTTYEPLVLYCVAALIYLMFSTVLSKAQGRMEKRFDRYVTI